MRQVFTQEERYWARAHRGRGRTISRDWHREPAPTDAAGETELVEPLRSVFLDAHRQHVRFPCPCGQLIAIQQFEHCFKSFWAFRSMFRIRPLPREQETLKLSDRHRLNLRAQTIERQAVNACEQSPLTPFELVL